MVGLIREIVNDYKWMIDDYRQWDAKTKVIVKAAMLGCAAMVTLAVGVAFNYSEDISGKDYYFDAAGLNEQLLSVEKTAMAVEHHRTGLER